MNRIDILKIFIENSHYDYFIQIAGKNKKYLTQGIKYLEDFDIKKASDFYKEYKLDPKDFPKIDKDIKSGCLKGLLKDKKLPVINLVFIVEDDLTASAALFELFLRDSEEFDWKVKIAEYLYHSNKAIAQYIEEDLLNLINLDSPELLYFPADSFAPIAPNSLFITSEIQVFLIEKEEQLDYIDFNSDVLGFDCEWKTDLTGNKYSKPALLQISSPSQVILYDLIKLKDKNHLNQHLWPFITNPNIDKVGVGIISDLNCLSSSYPELTCFNQKSEDFKDLAVIHKNCSGGNELSLSVLSEIYLSGFLCKNEQISNWEKRPLRGSQLHYAALDAFACVMIYKEMVNRNVLLSSPGDAKDIYLLDKALICSLCKSTLHGSDNCHYNIKCRFCGYFDHMVENCRCLGFSS